MIKQLKFSAIVLLMLFVTASCGSKSEKTATTQKVTTSNSSSSAKSQSVNLETSNVHWKGEMLGMYSHEGNISLSAGKVLMADNKLAGGSFTVDMTSIVPTDKNYDASKGQSADKLVGHLSSPDFFDVGNHPTATFEIKSVEGNTAKGLLTIRGKSGEETIERITINTDGSVSGSLKFNRKNYDVAFDHPMKEMVLSNDISLEIKLSLK